MRSWQLAEALLREARAFYGRGQVRYSELIKLFKYLQDDGGGLIKTFDPRDKKEPKKPRLVGYDPGTDELDALLRAPKGGAQDLKAPAKEGGFADVNFKFTSIWEPWFVDARQAIAQATSADQQHPERTTFVPSVGPLGKKTFAVGSKELSREPRLGPSPEHDPEREEGIPWHAGGHEMYDFIVEADLEDVPLNKGGPTFISRAAAERPKFVAKRIAWTPAIGDSNERAARLQSLLGGQRPPAAPAKQGPRGQAPERPAPADQSMNPLKGQTPREIRPGEPGYEDWHAERQRARVGALPPPLGSKERDDWEMSRPPEKRSALWKKKRGIE